jgi:hypothetical protein
MLTSCLKGSVLTSEALKGRSVLTRRPQGAVLKCAQWVGASPYPLRFTEA